MNDDPVLEWRAAPAEVSLRGDEVHLWRASLEPKPELSRWLAEDEWARASRFHFERDRQRFIAARGVVRATLSRYVSVPPDQLRFSIGSAGKPELQGAGAEFRFNISHSSELLLIAVTRDYEVGVDLEWMREDVPFEVLAERHFEPAESARIRSLPAPCRAPAFYEVWTRTEAQLKASGLGLSAGTSVVQPDRWSVRSFTPAPGYAAAIAVGASTWQLVCWS